MSKVTPQELKDGLRDFYGTQHYYCNPFYRQMKYTDGVKYFAEVAGAYWFLDIIGTEYEPLQRKTGESFLNIVLKVKNGKAKICVDDGNDNALRKDKNISYTDCPEGEWQFFMESGVLLLPSEH